MKLVIKSTSSVKLYSGELSYESIALFLKENFGSEIISLSYVDKDSDKISITTQDDVEVLKELTKEN